MFAGREQTLFEVHGAKLAVLICYESVFPNLTRTAVKRGADILINITNDAWYGKSSAPYQLLAMAAMRSVETKAPMVRVANTGISAVIQSDGTITARTSLFKRGTENRARVLAAGEDGVCASRRYFCRNLPRFDAGCTRHRTRAPTTKRSGVGEQEGSP